MKPTDEALIRANAQKAAKRIVLYVTSIKDDPRCMYEECLLTDIKRIIIEEMMKPEVAEVKKEKG